MHLTLSFVCLLGLALGQPTVVSNAYNYHEAVGIKEAARIKAAEENIDFSGSRIVGGSPAPLGMHPHLGGLVITLTSGFNSACGSSVLTNTRLLTAAHCWYDGWSQAELFTVVLGSTTLFYGGVRIPTTDVIMHPGWTGFMNLVNDIAIINIPWTPYSNVIQNVLLPIGDLESNSFVGIWTWAAGYGLQADGVGLAPDQAQHHVELRVISNAECRARFGNVVLDTHLCTSGEGGRNICSSDSGGPLTFINNGRRILIGVVSFGAIQCEAGSPGGYERVTSYLPWIQSLIN